jgi:hypothetical protein
MGEELIARRVTEVLERGGTPTLTDDGEEGDDREAPPEEPESESE